MLNPTNKKYVKYVDDVHIFYFEESIWKHYKENIRESFLLARLLSDFSFPKNILSDIKDRKYGSLEHRIEDSIYVIKTIKEECVID